MLTRRFGSKLRVVLIDRKITATCFISLTAKLPRVLRSQLQLLSRRPVVTVTLLILVLINLHSLLTTLPHPLIPLSNTQHHALRIATAPLDLHERRVLLLLIQEQIVHYGTIGCRHSSAVFLVFGADSGCSEVHSHRLLSKHLSILMRIDCTGSVQFVLDGEDDFVLINVWQFGRHLLFWDIPLILMKVASLGRRNLRVACGEFGLDDIEGAGAVTRQVRGCRVLVEGLEIVLGRCILMRGAEIRRGILKDLNSLERSGHFGILCGVIYCSFLVLNRLRLLRLR